MSQGRSTRWSLGMGCFPTLNDGNPYFMGPEKNPIGLMTITYNMEISGV